MSNAPGPTTEKTQAQPGPVLAGAAPPVKAKKLNLVVVLLGGILLGGGGVAGYWVVSKKNADNHADDQNAAAAAEEEKSKPKPRGKIVKLKPVIVNLKHSKGTRYLKISIGVEASSEEVLKELEALEFPLADMMQEKFSTLELEKVDTVEARNGLKRELLIEINELLETGPVNKIFFAEFIIQ
jgi:flagellar protein FliL